MAIQMGGGSQSTLLNEINITPFVDVALVLLVIFMITAPMIGRGVEVNLPRTRAAVMEVDQSKILIVVNERREVFIGEEQIPPERLEIVLRTNERIQTEREVYLQADRNIPYGFVVHIMSILREAGVDQLGMVTDPLDNEGELTPPTAAPDPAGGQASATEASATEASATEASATEASATEASSTEASSTGAGSTGAGSTGAGSTGASSTETTGEGSVQEGTSEGESAQ
jgi:biopolymer transport protein TolR